MERTHSSLAPVLLDRQAQSADLDLTRVHSGVDVRGDVIRFIAYPGIFLLGVSGASLIGYLVYGRSRKYLLTVLSVSFTLGTLVLLLSVFLANFPN